MGNVSPKTEVPALFMRLSKSGKNRYARESGGRERNNGLGTEGGPLSSSGGAGSPRSNSSQLNTVGFGAASGGSPASTKPVPLGIVYDPDAEIEGGANESLVEV